MYNPLKETLEDCSGFGEVSLEIKVSPKGVKKYSTRGKGRSFFYYQLICGDPVDTYSPLPNHVTALKFDKIFKGVTNDQEAWLVVSSFYKEHFGDISEYVDSLGNTHKGNWKDILQNYTDTVHMRRFPGDRLDVRKILKQFEIT